MSGRTVAKRAALYHALCVDHVHVVAKHLQAAEYTRQATMDSITIPVGPRLGDIVVEAEGLRKCFGERVLLDNATFSVPPGSVVGAAAARLTLQTLRRRLACCWLCHRLYACGQCCVVGYGVVHRIC